MTNEEIKDELNGVPYQEVGLDAISPALEDIQAWLDRITPWGLNPGRVSVRDFEIAGVLTTPAATPFLFVQAGPQILFKHKSTGKTSIHQAYPPPMRNSSFFHYATANALVALASD